MNLIGKTRALLGKLLGGAGRAPSGQDTESAMKRGQSKSMPPASSAQPKKIAGKLDKTIVEPLDTPDYREQLRSLVKAPVVGAPQADSSQSASEARFRPPGNEPALIPTSIEESASPWRTLWLTQLLCRITPELEESLFPPAHSDDDLVDRETKRMVALIFYGLDSYTGELNALLSASRVRISTTRPTQLQDTQGMEVIGRDKKPKISYYRCRASTASWSLSIRGAAGVVELFLVPGSEVIFLTQAESESRLKVRLRLSRTVRGAWWSLDGLPVSEIDLMVLVRSLLKDLVLRSVGSGPTATDDVAQLLNLEGERLAQAVHQLVTEKQNLVQKIVMQQEEVQNRIARDLHDAVIADVMMLKRSLSENRTLPASEINGVLDRVTSQLREICHDLAPRDLKDWGLQTVLEDMLQRVAERMSADCQLTCETEIPDLPNAVQLHIFRIIQECLNNVEKYSRAKRVAISIDLKGGVLRLTVQDDGQGYSTEESGVRRTREGGRGMGSIRERAELIRAFYPAQLLIESVPERGSRTILEIDCRGGSQAQPQ